MNCITPFHVEHKLWGKIPVPCGRCPPCYSRRVSGWSFRLRCEEKRAENALFITLTYDTEFVPISKNGFMSLNKRDTQLMWKKLRKANPNVKLRYFIVGEYGGKTMRPHYHAIVFNVTHEMVEKSWQKGIIHYGEVSGASIGYTLKYMAKPSKVPLHKNDDRVKEFQCCSKGLGENYITEAIKGWHHADVKERVYINIEDGKKIAMPRYYKERIYNEAQKMTIRYHQEKLSIEMEKDFEERRKKNTLLAKQMVEAHQQQFQKFKNKSNERDKF